MENTNRPKVENLKARLKIAQEVWGNTLLSKPWVLKHIIGFSSEDVKHIVKSLSK